MPEILRLRGRSRGFAALGGVFAVLAALRGGWLLHAHSLNSIDGALQTWFAADHFARGEQLGTAFQSYLGITMVLALLPVFVGFGKTLFASTLAAYTLVLAGAFACSYACAWLIRPIPPRTRWQAALVLLFLFYFAGPIGGHASGIAWPATLDPGVSLRPLRGALAFFVLPFFVVLVRRVVLESHALAGGLPLGLVAGAGLLWSNDAGIPLVIALAAALVLALWERPVLLAKTLAMFGLGVAASAGATLLAVTHGSPGPWLRYNFRDVAADQFWFFAPWERATRILSPADLPQILAHADPLAALGLVVLALSLAFAAVQRLRRRSAPVRGSAFVFVGASLLGTALVPQIGGHVGAEYNGITFVLAACAPLIALPAGVWRRARCVLRLATPRHLTVLTSVAALAMVGAETARLAALPERAERTVFDPALGFHVTPEYAADLAAMRKLAAGWDAAGIPAERRLLSVYTSPLDIAAGVRSPADVGSLIHALGPEKRAAFTALVARAQVNAVTTIAPDYSGWEGWLTRASWPFFRALRENYAPLARNDQQVLWVRAEGKRAAPAPATCRVAARDEGRLVLEVAAPAPGLAAVSVTRQPPFASGRGAMLTVVEDSPDTIDTTDRWAGFPRYGIANVAALELMAPVAPDRATRLTLETLDGSAVGNASCTASVLPEIDFAALPSLSEGIARHLPKGTR
ncbi:MAG: hypothetical protein NBV68_00510 [Erythrobacter sp.]|uniref:hypothetical protein n=1 Tax=Erythrobacter sp. TaxID=1042 RepID=UPI0025F59C23|nr:hypothetical protein [Erythrobacter sp.]MCL9997839.1 hypothetical protein [Erythrobacter sp.]